jgi:hypothetical protein
MFTIDRINNIRRNFGLEEVILENITGGVHERLNELDCHAGIDTSGGIKPAPLGISGVVPVNYVGARLALHERRFAPAIRSRFYHWLGYDACCRCGCGEHRRD